MVLLVGKWYVVDRFSGPVAGPFDSKKEAEAERKQLNIAVDCQSGVYKGPRS